MSIFEPVTLAWKGEEYTIEPDRIMMLIAKIEDVITLSEVYACSQKGAAPLAKIAMAYGIALRYAGAKVRDDEVYKGMFSNGDAGIPDALTALLTMMVPPVEHQDTGKPPAK